MTNTLKILCVDDCEVTVHLLKVSMGRYNTDFIVSMDIAISVSDAIVKFSSDEHMAALIDWNLPDGKGTDVAQNLRSHNPSLPIIFLSAVFTDEQYQAAQIYSPMLCLVKDHSKEYVNSIVSHITNH